jgi:hypothetical protein
LTSLLVGSIALALLGFGALALPFFVVGAVVWLVLLPVRLLFGWVFGGLFRVFGLLGALLGLIVAPLALITVGVALLVAFLAALLALVTPLIPVVLLCLLGWGVYRVAIRPTPAL